MAETLGVGVGTVTRAYLEAEARLATANVGRGTFVAGQAEQLTALPGGPVDLAMNIAPVGQAEAHLTEALGRVRRRSDLRAHFALSAAGRPREPSAGGRRWLADTANVAGLDWKRLIVTGGADGYRHRSHGRQPSRRAADHRGADLLRRQDAGRRPRPSAYELRWTTKG